MVNASPVPVVYLGTAPIEGRNVIQCSDLKQVLAAAKKQESCLVAIDDVDSVIQTTEYGEMVQSDKRIIMGILEVVSGSRKGFICTLPELHVLSSAMRDRISIQVEPGFPSRSGKLSFLGNEFGSLIPKKYLSFISGSTTGYNFRDLHKLAGIAYMNAEGSITKESIAHALREYVPPSMNGFDVCNKTGIKFSDVVGRDSIKKSLMRNVSVIQNKQLAGKLGVKRANLLMFHGPPGTGKTYLAKALAGEVGWPLLSVKARHIYSRSPFSGIKEIVDSARRFSNCIIFLDEAEKLLARSTMDEDSPIQGDLQSELDGVAGAVNCLVIFSVNEPHRFGASLKDRFRLFEFSYPDEDERSAFIERKLESVKPHMKLSVDRERLVKMTANMSYRTIERAWNEAAFHFVDTNKEITTDDFSGFLKNAAQEDAGDVKMFG